jgi:hypothetical protein
MQQCQQMQLLVATTDYSTRLASSPAQTPSIIMSSSGCAVKQSPICFPWKLHEMLSDASHFNFDIIVSWLPDETGFRVHDVEKFVQTVMPRYFNQTKYKSFQRQLNMWGFERVRTEPFKGGYIHECFVRGKPSLCNQMRRQKVKAVKQGCGVPTPVNPAHALVIKSDEFFESSLSSSPQSAAADILVADLMIGNSKREQQHHGIEKGSAAIFSLVSPHQQHIECLEFEGRTFFDIVFEGDCASTTTCPSITASRGHHNLVMSSKSRRRFSLEFVVPTHA